MTRLCSLPFVVAPEEAGRNAFAKLLSARAVFSLRSFQPAASHWLRRSGHFASWRSLAKGARVQKGPRESCVLEGGGVHHLKCLVEPHGFILQGKESNSLQRNKL